MRKLEISNHKKMPAGIYSGIIPARARQVVFV